MIQKLLGKLFTANQIQSVATQHPQKIYLFQTDQNILKDITTKPFPPGQAPGYVYFVQEHMNGSFKIGKTKNIEKRMNVFGVKLPFKNELVFLIKSGNHHQTEAAFHRYFANKRIEGEWFSLSENDLEWIKKGDYSDEIQFTIIESHKVDDSSNSNRIEPLTKKQIEYVKTLIGRLEGHYELLIPDNAITKKDLDRLLVYFRYKNDRAIQNLVKNGVLRKIG
ncbi:GIY-YIG nuclease family protein [Metabacillus sp. SLBN-84]